MHQLITDKQAGIEAICRKYKVARLEIFGSAARGTDFDPDKSDADFLVEYQPPLLPGMADRYFGMFQELSTELGRKVHLLSIGSIRNPYLKQSIDEDRKVIYEA